MSISLALGNGLPPTTQPSASAELLSVRVCRKLDRVDPLAVSLSFRPGIDLAYVVQMEHAKILCTYIRSSDVRTFRDNCGTDLRPIETNASGFLSYDQSQCSLEIHLDRRVARAASHFEFVGDLTVLYTTAATETIEFSVDNVDAGKTFGNLPIKLVSAKFVTPTEYQLEFSAPQPLGSVISCTFINEHGEVIDPATFIPDNIDKGSTWSSTFAYKLEEPVTHVRLEYDSEVSTLTVPVHVTGGIGLGGD